MNYELLILKRAELELEEIYEYYFNKSIKILQKFDLEINKIYEILKVNPFFEVKYKNLRFLPLKKFPYIIIFSVDKSLNKVFIYSIFHTSQNTEKYPKI